MSVLEVIADQVLGSLVKHPEVVKAAQDAIAAGVSGERLVEVLKREMTAASDFAMVKELET